MNTPELREQTATQLLAAANRASQMTAFVGLDGFVDEILHVVDKRDNAESFQRLPTIARFAGGPPPPPPPPPHPPPTPPLPRPQHQRRTRQPLHQTRRQRPHHGQRPRQPRPEGRLPRLSRLSEFASCLRGLCHTRRSSFHRRTR